VQNFAAPFGIATGQKMPLKRLICKEYFAQESATFYCRPVRTALTSQDLSCNTKFAQTKSHEMLHLKGLW